MATLLNIKQPSWSKQETTGEIGQKHWPKLEKILCLERAAIESAAGEAELTNILARQQDTKTVLSCAVNITINAENKSTVDNFMTMLEQIARLQIK